MGSILNMLSSFWSGIKTVWGWLVDAWTAFDNFCAAIAPGVKTFVIGTVGLLGSTGAVLQEYFTNVPLTTFVTAEKATMISAGLFALVILSRHWTNVAASNAVSTS